MWIASPGVASTFADAAVAEAAGQDSHDILIGSSRADTISAGHGWDYVEGGVGSDLIDGGMGEDVILAGDGNDTVYADEQAVASSEDETVIAGVANTRRPRGDEHAAARHDADRALIVPRLLHDLSRRRRPRGLFIGTQRRRGRVRGVDFAPGPTMIDIVAQLRHRRGLGHTGLLHPRQSEATGKTLRAPPGFVLARDFGRPSA